MRSGTCYRKVNEENLVCDMPVIGGPTFKKANCCCSAFAQAWGSPCEICPPKNSGKLWYVPYSCHVKDSLDLSLELYSISWQPGRTRSFLPYRIVSFMTTLSSFGLIYTFPHIPIFFKPPSKFFFPYNCSPESTCALLACERFLYTACFYLCKI